MALSDGRQPVVIASTPAEMHIFIHAARQEVRLQLDDRMRRQAAPICRRLSVPCCACRCPRRGPPSPKCTSGAPSQAGGISRHPCIRLKRRPLEPAIPQSPRRPDPHQTPAPDQAKAAEPSAQPGDPLGLAIGPSHQTAIGRRSHRGPAISQCQRVQISFYLSIFFRSSKLDQTGSIPTPSYMFLVWTCAQ